MTQWFPERTENMIRIYQQNELFPELMAARFSQRGGIVEAGTSVTLTSDSGKMYYTLDGSDPRVMGGALSDSAIEYTGPITVDDDVTVRVRVLDGEIWSAIDEAEYKVGGTFATADSLRISEVHYNPALPTQAEREAGFTDKDDFEFVEVVNVSNEVIDLSNAQLQQITIGADVHGVDFDFADGAITELAPGDRIVIVEDTAAFAMRYPNVTAVAGEWSGGLSNASETITLGDSAGIFQQFTYSDLWQPKTDGDGFSLELINPADANLDNWNVAGSWQQSSGVGGSPGGTSGPVAGDSNHDGIFDSGDFVVVFQAGEYEDGIDGNSTFEEGDWNGDGDFSSADFVFVFQIGNYVAAAMPINRHSEFAGGRDDLAQPNVINREVSPDAPVQGNPSESIELRPADAVDTIFGEWESPETVAEEHDLVEDDDLSKWDLLV